MEQCFGAGGRLRVLGLGTPTPKPLNPKPRGKWHACLATREHSSHSRWAPIWGLRWLNQRALGLAFGTSGERDFQSRAVNGVTTLNYN